LDPKETLRRLKKVTNDEMLRIYADENHKFKDINGSILEAGNKKDWVMNMNHHLEISVPPRTNWTWEEIKEYLNVLYK